MGFIKSMFGGGDKSPPPSPIESPAALKPGDMVKMEFAEQALISGQTLKVTDQVFYDISAVESCKTVSTMTGVDQNIFLSTSSVNPERPLEIAIAILPERIFDLFKRKKFVAIFEEPDDTDHRLKCKLDLNELNELQGFVSKSYFQERTNEAYRSKKDCRNTSLSEHEWSAFDYKLMVSDDRQHAIRIEVYNGGRTDVYLIAYLPLNKVESYWPA
ncbi:MAG: hypothetical protein GXP13_10730 [Gammaproteobacteria bacterium]|nr:hypothetical protein [Gammaproteobacteria bacterium]